VGRGSASTGTVLVVDDDEAFRTFLCALLEEAGYEVEGEGTGAGALPAMHRKRFAVVILDVYLKDISGYEVCRKLRKEFGEAVGVIFVSGERVEALDRVAGLRLGGDDYLAKPFAPDELLARVERLRCRVAATAAAISPHTLTPRELEVLELLAEGLPQKEIARRLVLSPRTVARHIEHILGKLGVHSRAQAVALAYRHGLLGSLLGARRRDE
jgi:two-component system, NarL family, nitrate/nitrite response regulator NarL